MAKTDNYSNGEVKIKKNNTLTRQIIQSHVGRCVNLRRQ